MNERKQGKPLIMKENAILRAIRAKLGTLRLPFFRYTVGTFIAPDGTMVHIGEKGVSDLIGIVPHVIRKEDVGHTVGVFVALEAKQAGGRVRKEQGPFLRMVNSLGGLGAVVRSAEDAADVVDRKWESELVRKWTPED